jgi:hypothetical protein
MATLMMSGPHALTHSAIDRNVPRHTAGIFILGRLDGGVLTKVGRVGRSDSDLADELRRFVGKWPGFLFQAASSRIDAFHLECALFHEVKRLDLPHPVRPEGTDFTCTICGACAAAAEELSDIAQRVEFYRQKAREVRAAAAEMKPTARPPLLGLADSYERLAEAMGSMRLRSET